MQTVLYIFRKKDSANYLIFRLFLCKALDWRHRNWQHSFGILFLVSHFGLADQRLLLALLKSVTHPITGTSLLEDKLLFLQRNLREPGLAHRLSECCEPVI